MVAGPSKCQCMQTEWGWDSPFCIIVDESDLYLISQWFQTPAYWCHSVPRRLLCYLLVFKLLQAAKSLVLGRKIFASGCGCTILKIHVDIQALERFKASMNYELPCSTSHSQEASSNLFLNHLSNHAYNAHFLMKIMYSTTPNLPPFLKTTPIQIDERKRI